MTPDIDGSAERAVVAPFQGADVLGLDLGGVGQLMDRQFTFLAGSAQLFCDSGHCRAAR